MLTTGLDTITAELIDRSIHDLAGPANRIRALAQLLGRNLAEGDTESHKLLGFIVDSAADVGTVADGLRRYLQISTRQVQLQPLDLTLPLKSAIRNLAQEIATLRGEVTYGSLPVVEADGYLMCWVFQELLTNALRFGARTDSRIHVSAGRTESGHAFVSVADNGRGIDSDMGEKIFRPFNKLEGDGAGMGLAICRKIIEMQGGRIWLGERMPGAEFRFSIDVIAQDASA
jgi:light-regulated signal transduction histidine kinase (bacteriophytochrome)